MATKPKFVLIQGVGEENYLDRFFTVTSPDKDESLYVNGKLVYEIIGYAETVQEAQMKLYGRTYD